MLSVQGEGDFSMCKNHCQFMWDPFWGSYICVWGVCGVCGCVCVCGGKKLFAEANP